MYFGSIIFNIISNLGAKIRIFYNSYKQIKEKVSLVNIF